MYSKLSLLIVSIFSAVISLAQTHVVDITTVDSLQFRNARNEIDKLPNTFFEKKTFKKRDKEIPYRLLLPQNFSNKKKYPLIITLHNSSRIGKDNEKQLEQLAKIWLRPDIYQKYPAIVIAPQFNNRSSLYSKNENGILVSNPSDEAKVVLDLLKQVEQEYKIDKSKIFLVGYSMGGSTGQNLMNLAPKKFAAIVSIAAVPDFSNLRHWNNKRIFLAHGKEDLTNPYSGSEALFNKLSKNKNVTFVTFNTLNHNNITIPFLLSDRIPDWLFQRKSF